MPMEAQIAEDTGMRSTGRRQPPFGPSRAFGGGRSDVIRSHPEARLLAVIYSVALWRTRAFFLRPACYEGRRAVPEPAWRTRQVTWQWRLECRRAQSTRYRQH